jgi:hypothetical protein
MIHPFTQLFSKIEHDFVVFPDPNHLHDRVYLTCLPPVLKFFAPFGHLGLLSLVQLTLNALTSSQGIFIAATSAILVQGL